MSTLPARSYHVVCNARPPKATQSPTQRRAFLGAAAATLVTAVAAPKLPGISQKHTENAPAHVGPSNAARVKEGLVHFVTGGLAGSAGAAAVYPIDLVKTRLQNDRSALGEEPKYANAWDCAAGVVREEGLGALYQGLAPQLVGVWPEKAVKLATNDYVRALFVDPVSGAIPVAFQVLAGGCGGLCQVVFTNPLEIVKVRLQVVEAGRDGRPPSPIQVVRELGFTGLYKGAGVCIARDVPFSMIYFPTFAALKMVLSGGSTTSPLSLFFAGLLAGVPAAFLVTPADVIKTRIQVDAREEEDVYNGPIDCAEKIVDKEGPAALFKGGLQRVLRSAPQFGVTLLVYELLNRFV